MRNYIILLLLVFYFQNVFSQNSINCEVSPLTNTNFLNVSSQTHYPGFRKASIGNLKMLLVFVREKDDNINLPQWPSNNSPTNMSQYLSIDESSIDVSNSNNISGYFKESSNDQFIVTGKTLSIELEKKLHEYADYNLLSDSTWRSAYLRSIREVSQKVFSILDTTISEYDNWDYGGKNNHINIPDDEIDLILVVYKSFPSSPDGFVSYRNWSETNNNGYVINNKSVAFTKPYGGKVDFGIKEIGIHEIGHYLITGSHPYLQNDINHSHHSIFGVDWLQSQVNAYEKEELGWTNVPEISSDQIIELHDFLTTNDAVKIKNPHNQSSNEYLYIEYHSKISVFDNFTDNDQDKGLVIYNVKQGYDNDVRNIRLESSSGRWDWNVLSTTAQQHFDGSKTALVFERDKLNPVNGFSARGLYEDSQGDKHIFLHISNTSLPHNRVHQGIEFYGARFDRGFYYKTAFNLEGNAFYSSITNPSPITYSGQPFPISLRIFEETSNSIQFDLTFNPNPYIITEDTKVGGQLLLEQNLYVENNSTLTLNKGTTVYLDDQVQIVVRPGSKLIVNGTQDERVEFRQMYPNYQWKGIWLQGEGSSINYATFNGGKHQLMVQADNISITNSTFENGWRGIDSYADQQQIGTRSSYTVDNCRFENMSSTGITLYNSDAELNEITSKNTSTGIYVRNGDLAKLTHSLIRNNSSGLYLASGSTFQRENKFTKFESNYNGVYVSGPFYSTMGDFSSHGPGYNSFINNANKDIDVSGTYQMYAINNYFYPYPSTQGNVPISPTYYADVTNTPGSNLEMNNFNEQLLNKSAKSKQDLLSSINNNDGDAINSLIELYQRLKTKDIEVDINDLKKITNYKKNSLNNQLIEISQIMYVRHKWGKKVDKDFKKITNRFLKESTTKLGKSELFSAYIDGLIMNQEEYLALELINERLNESKNLRSEELLQLQDLSEVITTQIEINSLLNREKQTFQNSTSNSKNENTEKLISAYPNPFNPTTTLRFELTDQKQVKIEVYNILGKLVYSINKGQMNKGIHTVKIDGKLWSSGLYIYKAQFGSRIETGKLFLIK